MAERKKDVMKEYIKMNKAKETKLPYKDKKGELLFEVKINPNISLVQRKAMIEYICDVVFGGEDRYNIKNYDGGLVTFAKRCATLSFFTDLEMPEKYETLFDLVMNTSLYEDVLPHVEGVLKSIMGDVDEVIKTCRNTGIYNYNIIALAERLEESASKLSEKLKDVNLGEVKGLLEKFKGLNTESVVEEILKLKK